MFQGNDQIRFELTCYSLAPQIKVGCCFSPLKGWVLVAEAQGGESRAQGSLGGSPERGLVAGGALLPWGTPFTYSSRRGQLSVPDRSSFLEMLPPAPGWVRHWTERRGCPSSSILAGPGLPSHVRTKTVLG